PRTPVSPPQPPSKDHQPSHSRPPGVSSAHKRWLLRQNYRYPKMVLPGYADTDTLQALETLVGRHLVSLTTTSSSRTKRHSQRHDDETESTSQSYVEQPRLPASAWRRGRHGSAWVLIGAGEPQQIDLIDPDHTQPFADWLRPAEEAPQPAEVATLPQQ
ncbi:MAG: hypothetical protein ACYDHB_09385, partial [Candidatus Dormibacteria bacterium]